MVGRGDGDLFNVTCNLYYGLDKICVALPLFSKNNQFISNLYYFGCQFHLKIPHYNPTFTLCDTKRFCPQVESRELDVGIARVDLMIKQHNDTRAEIDTFKPKYQTLLDDGGILFLIL